MQSLQQLGTNLANMDMTWHRRLQLTWIQLYYLVHGGFHCPLGFEVFWTPNWQCRKQQHQSSMPMAHHGPWHAVSRCPWLFAVQVQQLRRCHSTSHLPSRLSHGWNRWSFFFLDRRLNVFPSLPELLGISPSWRASQQTSLSCQHLP